MQFPAFLQGGLLCVLIANTSSQILQGQAVSTGATFGNVIALGGTPSDIVLDEGRGMLYTLNSSANRIDMYDYLDDQKAGSIPVGLNTSSTVSVIDLNRRGVIQSVTIPAKPEGIEVGADGRVLICTQGTGGTTNNVLYILDLTQPLGQQLTPVAFPPPASVHSGANVVQVNSLAMAQSSTPIVVTVQK